jgi:uncharacterized membrane protein YraQ (UPF0718 family)
MAFEVASTNLVVELGIIIALLIGWQFTLGEFIGGPLMIVFVALLFRRFVKGRIVEAARAQAERGIPGSMEGHASMDMSIQEGGGFWHRLLSPQGFTAVSHIFVAEWDAILRDVAGGLALAGAIGAWVPNGFWRRLFLTGNPLLAKVWGPLIGPIVAVLSFVCSIGNVPLAAVLWNGGISFGGVMSFIFADLIVLPILLIYRKYYGTRMALVIFVVFYVSMVAAGYVVEVLFSVLHLIPHQRAARVVEASITWNYTTFLNLAFLVVAAVLVIRFLRTGGVPMLRMMNAKPHAAGHGGMTA